MSYNDSLDLNVSQSGSHLLSESYDLSQSNASSSRTGPGGDDLSLSDLALEDRPRPLHRRPFSLLALPRDSEPSGYDESAIAEEEEEDEGALEQTMTQEDVEKAKKLKAKAHEEKLQNDIFVLKKLNSALELYKDALRGMKTRTENVAMKIEYTSKLLSNYENILIKSENVTRLILDERWQGAEADEELLEREAQEEHERKIREEEELKLAAQRERERIVREERERQEREEREAREKERSEKAKSASARGSGVRGVRGTRASMRGARAASRATPPMGRPSRAGSTATGSGDVGISGIARPTSSASARLGNTTATSRLPRKT